MGPFLLLAGTFLLMWVLFILPQQRRLRAHQAVVRSLQVGDDVITTAGMYGTITAIDDDTDVVHLEVAPGTVVRLARGAIGSKVGDDDVGEDTTVDALDQGEPPVEEA